MSAEQWRLPAEAAGRNALRLKTPRWLLIAESVLLLCSLLFLAYKAAMRIRPLGVVRQPPPLKTDPLDVVRGYYRDFPGHYIRVDRESWRYDFARGGGEHTLELRNTATVGYRAIRLRFRYESATGRELGSKEIALVEDLEPGGTIRLRNLFVAGAPREADRVVTVVAGADVRR